MVGVIKEEPYRFGIAPSVIPWYKSNFCEEFVSLHFLEQLCVVNTAVPRSEKWVIYNQAGERVFSFL
jgi:hypothetical protein